MRHLGGLVLFELLSRLLQLSSSLNLKMSMLSEIILFRTSWLSSFCCFWGCFESIFSSTETVPPLEVNLMAFDKKLMRICE